MDHRLTRLEIMRNHPSVVFALSLIVVAASASLHTQVNIERLKDPAQLNERAPYQYRARFDTSQGMFVIAVQREWAPLAADRFYNLVKNGFYNDSRFFRVLSGFMAQWGLHADPAVQAAWRTANLKDEPAKKRGLLGLFFCASLEDQFEHLLSQWGDATPMGPPNRGTAKDPFIGARTSVSLPPLDPAATRGA